MTPYERTVIQRELKKRQDAIYQIASSSMLTEFNSAVGNYQKAQEGVKSAIAAEIDSWDAGKLSQQMDAVGKMIDLAKKHKDVGRLEKVFNEALQSNDKYKKRATFELMTDITDGVSWNDRFAANRLARAAEKELPNLRVSQDMLQADNAVRYSGNQLLHKLDELIDTSIVLGQGDPTSGFAGGDFAHAVRRIKRGPGMDEITVLPDDDPEVSRSYEVVKDKAHFAE